VKENANTGWVAKVGGRTLDPVTLDGWAQGWRLPAGGPAVVTLTFTPQRTYQAALVAGGVLALLLVAGTATVVVRRRRGGWVPRPRAPYPHGWLTHGMGLFAAAVVSAFAGMGVLGGALIGLAPGVGAMWVKRGLVVVAVVGAAWWQVKDGGTSNVADLVAALAVGMTIGPLPGGQQPEVRP
jgi:arabinofuranan 3-O-arabinosyltransferase